MQPSENAEVVLQKRYYQEGENWEALCRRVACALTSDKVEQEEFFNAMYEFKFLPNSPTLMNAGTELNNLSACFKIDLKDSMEDIMDTAKKMAIIFKEGGGVGIALDNIREKDARVKKTNGAASGVVSFMELYNTVGNVVKQGGRRRSALICALRVDHPEILDFISCKDDLTKLNNCNISVTITDDFMKKAEAGLDYDLISPVNGKVGTLNAREVLHKIAEHAHKSGEPGLLFIDTANKKDPTPQFGRMNGTNPCLTGDTLIAVADGRNYVSIKQLAEDGEDVQVFAADENGNPVVSTMRFPRLTGNNKEIYNVVLSNGKSIKATGNHKFVLSDGTKVEVKDLMRGNVLLGMKHLEKSCNCHIESISKAGYADVYNGTVDTYHNYYVVTQEDGNVDIANSLCINVLNCGEQWLRNNSACNLLSINMLQVNTDEEIKRYSKLAVRFLNAVIDAGKYPLPEIAETVKKERNIGLGVMGWADYLATKRIPYDSQQGRIEAKRISKLINDAANEESIKIAEERNEYIETRNGTLRYNSTLTCIAPTGTISMIADCSSGIEPYFALSYTKNVLDGHSFRYFNPVLKKILKEESLWCSEVKSQIAKYGSIQGIDTIPQNIKDVFKTAGEISMIAHVKMQAAWQEHIENSISKTANAPSEATVDDVLLAYVSAYKNGCKGITVYRDGSRSGQVLTSPKSKIEKCPECSSKELSHDSGCVTCANCGWSKCSI